MRTNRILALAAALASLAGCTTAPSGPITAGDRTIFIRTGDYQLQGQNIDIAGSLTSLEKTWRERARANEKLVAIPDDAHCHFQVFDKHLTGLVICGPMRWEDSRNPSGQAFEVVPDGRGGVRIDGRINETSLVGQSDLYRPDGVSLAPSPSVELPEVTIAEVGKPFQASQQTWGPAMEVSTPTGRIRINVAAPTKGILGVGREKKKPADGNTLVSWQIFMGMRFSERPENRYSVRVGGRTFPVPDDSDAVSTFGYAMAVPGDGKDAVLVIEFAGGSHEISLDGRGRVLR